MNLRFSLLLLAGFAPATFGQLIGQDPSVRCSVTNPAIVYPASPLTYPLLSDQYAVQYRLGGNDWTDAAVRISYYGGTNSSPFDPASGYISGMTSMSFVSIPTSASAGIEIRVIKLSSSFQASDNVSVRPRVKIKDVFVADDGTAHLIGVTASDFAGDQFMLWWGDETEGGGVEALAIFLDPAYDPPTGPNVKVISAFTDLQNLNKFDTLIFQGTFTLGGIGNQAYQVPNNITSIFFAPGAWVQGKLHFQQNGQGRQRRIYGPGVLDVSRFEYDLRSCDSNSMYPEQGYEALSWDAPPNKTPTPDAFVLDGIVITDHNHATTDPQVNGVVNNVKSMGWNSLNGGFRLGDNTKVSNVFLRAGDDSLMMWGHSVTVTNATIWQTYNGAPVNLGWGNDSPGDDCLIDGLYVVKMDWHSPNDDSSFSEKQLDGQNDAVITSLMVPGTNFGTVHPPLFRNIIVEDTPRTLVSLKILSPQCNDPNGPRYMDCSAADLTQPSVLNLNIENLVTPASTLGNLIGFQTFKNGLDYEYPAGTAHTLPSGYTLTGTMDIGMTNVLVRMPNGTVEPLNNANAATVGQIATSGDNVTVTYSFSVKSLISWLLGLL